MCSRSALLSSLSWLHAIKVCSADDGPLQCFLVCVGSGPELRQNLQKALLAADAVGVLTRALPVLPLTGGAGVFELAQLLVGRERRLGRHFAQQYVAAGGLRPACLDRCEAGAIIDAMCH